MTTNKPEVVAWIWDYRGRHMATTDYSQALELAEPPYPTEVEPLVRLADYQRLQADHERLQAECAQLRAAIRRLCNIYLVDDYYMGQLREERLEAAVNRAINAAMQESSMPKKGDEA